MVTGIESFKNGSRVTKASMQLSVGRRVIS